MPKNTACPGLPWVSDPITDQEIAFARLILSGTMNDRRAAEAVGLNPETAAYTKSKPRVRAYMSEHRAAVNERLVDQEVDLSRLPRRAVGRAVDLSRGAVEGLRKLNIGRDRRASGPPPGSCPGNSSGAGAENNERLVVSQPRAEPNRPTQSLYQARPPEPRSPRNRHDL
jgi:hypothetical protein